MIISLIAKNVGKSTVLDIRSLYTTTSYIRFIPSKVKKVKSILLIMEYSTDATKSFIPFQSTTGQESWKWIKQLSDNDYADAFELINITAKAGSNIGIGEYPTLETFSTILQKSIPLGLYDDSKILTDLVLVKPYHAVRHISPILGHIVLASRSHPVDQDRLNQLISIGCELATRKDCGGFQGCIAEVFYPCLTHLQAFKERHFVVTCAIPFAGLLAGRNKHSMSYVMYKDLRNEAANNASILIPQNVAFHLPKPIQFEYEIDFQPTLLKCSATLPVIHQSKTNISIIIRYLRPDELRNCYDAFIAAMDKGFGLNEFSTYEMFLIAKLHNSYCFVLEDANASKIIGYFFIGVARFTRCHTEQNRLGYSGGVYLPEYRGTGLGYDFMEILMSIASKCGFEHLVSTMAITNMPAVTACVFDRSSFIGTVPRSIYFSKTGWTDILAHHVFLGTQSTIRSLL